MLRFIQRALWLCEVADPISRHLMLRFIITIEEHEKQVIKFQYISCYGLSD